MNVVVTSIRLFFIIAFTGLLYSCDEKIAQQELKNGSDSIVVLNNMRNYLVQVAADITNTRIVPSTLSNWEHIRLQRYHQFLEMMGIDALVTQNTKNDLRVVVTGSVQKEGYRIEKLYFQSLPGLYVRGNLYIPDSIISPRPAILYASGHTQDQKVTYQQHPAKFAKMGFVCLLTETIQFGEVRGEHWGAARNGWFNWYSRGYNPGGVELYNAIRAIDLLCDRSEVDTSKIGVTGISGGGSQSWYITAADPRIKAAAPVCGAGTLKDHLLHRTLDGHCDCMMFNNIFLQDFKDIGALIAPRPLLVAQSDRDGIYRIEAVRELVLQIKNTYELYGHPENISLIETPGQHDYHPDSRQNVFAFFSKHLMGKELSPQQAGDIDTVSAHLSTSEDLKVYVNGPPENDRTTTIQHTFIPKAGNSEIYSRSSLDSLRDTVTRFLRLNTFHAFPKSPPVFDGKAEMASMGSEKSGNTVYTFNSENGWRLKVDVYWKNNPLNKKPLMIILRNYNDERWAAESFSNKVDSGFNVAYLEVRGVGETGWEPGLQWHLRRAAAWTGRTIASMQVWDVMRCIAFCRTLPNVDAGRIGIGAQNELGAIALYAALMDGKCDQVLLNNPPATQDKGGPPDGKDIPIEMLNCLQVTDVNQLPALILPAVTNLRVMFPGAITGRKK